MGKAKELALAVALNAVAAFTKREASRDVLTEGNSYDCDLRITGTSCGEKVSIPIRGDLAVGTTNPTGTTSGPPMNALLASAIEQMPKTRLERWLEKVKRDPDVLPESVQLAKSLVGRLSKKSSRAGGVKFCESAKPPKKRR